MQDALEYGHGKLRLDIQFVFLAWFINDIYGDGQYFGLFRGLLGGGSCFTLFLVLELSLFLLDPGFSTTTITILCSCGAGVLKGSDSIAGMYVKQGGTADRRMR